MEEMRYEECWVKCISAVKLGLDFTMRAFQLFIIVACLSIQLTLRSAPPIQSLGSIFICCKYSYSYFFPNLWQCFHTKVSRSLEQSIWSRLGDLTRYYFHKSFVHILHTWIYPVQGWWWECNFCTWCFGKIFHRCAFVKCLNACCSSKDWYFDSYLSCINWQSGLCTTSLEIVVSLSPYLSFSWG